MESCMELKELVGNSKLREEMEEARKFREDFYRRRKMLEKVMDS